MKYFKFEVFSANQCNKTSTSITLGPEFYYCAIVYCTNNASYYKFDVAKKGCINALNGNLNHLKSNYPYCSREIKHVEKIIERLSDLDECSVEEYCEANKVNMMQI